MLLKPCDCPGLDNR